MNRCFTIAAGLVALLLVLTVLGTSFGALGVAFGLVLAALAVGTITARSINPRQHPLVPVPVRLRNR